MSFRVRGHSAVESPCYRDPQRTIVLLSLLGLLTEAPLLDCRSSHITRAPFPCHSLANPTHFPHHSLRKVIPMLFPTTLMLFPAILNSSICKLVTSTCSHWIQPFMYSAVYSVGQILFLTYSKPVYMAERPSSSKTSSGSPDCSVDLQIEANKGGIGVC